MPRNHLPPKPTQNRAEVRVEMLEYDDVEGVNTDNSIEKLLVSWEGTRERVDDCLRTARLHLVADTSSNSLMLSM